MKNVIFILTLMGFLFSMTSFLLYDGSPYHFSTGSYDLLDMHAPITRTYSSVYALKDKSEVVFYHTALPNRISAENILAGLKHSFVKGLKFGIYASYLNLGDFNSMDERGEILEKLTASDILIGIPVMIDEEAIYLPKENALKQALKVVNFGININYFQESFGIYNSRTFFADVNTAVKIKLPYIGMPARIITDEDINREMNGVLKREGNAYNAKKKALKKQKDLTDRERINKGKAQRANYIKQTQRIKRAFRRKKEDISDVRRTRTDLFSIYNEVERELTLTDVSNFFQATLDDVEFFIRTTSNTVHEEVITMDSIINKDIRKNESDVKIYSDKFLSVGRDKNLSKNVLKLWDIVENYIEKEYEKRSPKIKKARQVKQEKKKTIPFRMYKVQSGENAYQAIERIGIEKEFVEAILALNNISTKLQLVKVRVLKIPEPKYLAVIKYGDMGYMPYKVKSGDTWEGIAERYLGDKKLYKKILLFNDRKKKHRPEPGEVIQIQIESGEAEEEKEIEALEEKEREERKRGFQNAARPVFKVINSYSMSEIESLYFDGVNRMLDKRVELHEGRKALSGRAEERYKELIIIYREARRELDKIRSDIIRMLTKIQLKKKLDLLNAKSQKARTDAAYDYKKQERIIFKGILREIFKSKEDLIKQAKRAEKIKMEQQTGEIGELYERKRISARDNYTIRKVALGDPKGKKEKFGKLALKYAKKRKEIDRSEIDELSKLRERFKKNINAYNWKLYTTKLTYLGSAEKPDTAALGGYAKNLGMPIKHQSKSEDLPAAFGGDLNYAFLNVKGLQSILYMHAGYSEITDLVLGGGMMYRFFKMIELRGGAVYEKEAVVAGAAAGLIFEIGLMNYRIDLGGKYDPVLGHLTYNFALNIIF
ncbi:LysM peptidoglycan-binding domain-containing protein [Spirochaetota bacterium]